MSVAGRLCRKADDYRALAEEHASADDARQVLFFVAVEAALREVAEALEEEDEPPEREDARTRT